MSGYTSGKGHPLNYNGRAPLARPTDAVKQQYDIPGIGKWGGPNQGTGHGDDFSNTWDVSEFVGSFQKESPYTRSQESFDTPDAFGGSSYWLRTVLITQMTADDTWWLQACPYYLAEDFQEFQYTIWEFNDHLPIRNPEESTNRLVTSQKREGSGAMHRFGIGGKTEYGFWKTAAGRLHYAMTFQQIKNAIVEGNCLAIAEVLLTVPREADSVQDLDDRKLSIREYEQLIQEGIDSWGIVHKRPDGFDVAYQRCQGILQARGVYNPDLTIVPRGLGTYLNARLENQAYAHTGAPNGKTVNMSRYGNVRESRAFRMGEKIPDMDPFYRQRSIGSFITMNQKHLSRVPDDDFRTAMCDTCFLSFDDNQYEKLSIETAFRHSGLFDLNNAAARAQDTRRAGDAFVSAKGHKSTMHTPARSSPVPQHPLSNLGQQYFSHYASLGDLLEDAGTLEHTYNRLTKLGEEKQREFYDLCVIKEEGDDTGDDDDQSAASPPPRAATVVRGGNKRPAPGRAGQYTSFREAVKSVVPDVDVFSKLDLITKAQGLSSNISLYQDPQSLSKVMALTRALCHLVDSHPDVTGDNIPYILAGWFDVNASVPDARSYVKQTLHAVLDLVARKFSDMLLPHRDAPSKPEDVVPYLYTDSTDTISLLWIDVSIDDEEKQAMSVGSTTPQSIPKLSTRQLADYITGYTKQFFGVTPGKFKGKNTPNHKCHELAMAIISKMEGMKEPLTQGGTEHVIGSEHAQDLLAAVYENAWRLENDNRIFVPEAYRFLVAACQSLATNGGKLSQLPETLKNINSAVLSVANDDTNLDVGNDKAGAPLETRFRHLNRRDNPVLYDVFDTYFPTANVCIPARDRKEYDEFFSYYLEDMLTNRVPLKKGKRGQQPVDIDGAQKSYVLLYLLAYRAWSEGRKRKTDKSVDAANILSSFVRQDAASKPDFSGLALLFDELGMELGDLPHAYAKLTDQVFQLAVKTATELANTTRDRTVNLPKPDFDSFEQFVEFVDQIPIRDGALFLWFLKNNVRLPLGFVVTWPHQRFQMGTMIVMVSGSQTCVSFIGFADVMTGSNPAIKTHLINVTYYSKAHVFRPKNIARYENIFVAPQGGYQGGGGKNIFMHNGSDVLDYQDGDLVGDMFICAVPLKWEPDGKFLDITGKYDSRQCGEITDDTPMMWPSAKYYADYWGWRHGEIYQNDDEHYFHPVKDLRYNTICVRGHQMRFEHRGGDRGTYTLPVINQGHWGAKIYEGCVDVYRGLATSLETPSYMNTNTYALAV